MYKLNRYNKNIKKEFPNLKFAQHAPHLGRCNEPRAKIHCHGKPMCPLHF